MLQACVWCVWLGCRFPPRSLLAACLLPSEEALHGLVLLAACARLLPSSPSKPVTCSHWNPPCSASTRPFLRPVPGCSSGICRPQISITLHSEGGPRRPNPRLRWPSAPAGLRHLPQDRAPKLPLVSSVPPALRCMLKRRQVYEPQSCCLSLFPPWSPHPPGSVLVLEARVDLCWVEERPLQGPAQANWPCAEMESRLPMATCGPRANTALSLLL